MAWFRPKDRSDPTADQGAEPALQPLAALPPSAPDTSSTDWYIALKRQLHQQVIGAIDLALIGSLGEEQLRLEVRRKAEALLPEEREPA